MSWFGELRKSKTVRTQCVLGGKRVALRRESGWTDTAMRLPARYLALWGVSVEGAHLVEASSS